MGASAHVMAASLDTFSEHEMAVISLIVFVLGGVFGFWIHDVFFGDRDG